MKNRCSFMLIFQNGISGREWSMMGQNESLVLRDALQFVPMVCGLRLTSPKGPEKPRGGLPGGVTAVLGAVGASCNHFDASLYM